MLLHRCSSHLQPTKGPLLPMVLMAADGPPPEPAARPPASRWGARVERSEEAASSSFAWEAWQLERFWGLEDTSVLGGCGRCCDDRGLPWGPPPAAPVSRSQACCEAALLCAGGCSNPGVPGSCGGGGG